MNRLVVTIILLFIISNVKAQYSTNYWDVDTLSSFNQPHNPFTDALPMWLLRQNLTINAYQTEFSSEFTISDNNDLNLNTYLVNYLPVYNKKSFSVTIGTSYSKTTIMTENDSLNKSIQDICLLWLPVQYTFNRWKFTFLYEHFLTGDGNSLFTKTGNTKRVFIISTYNFNLKWQLSLMTAYLETRMENENRKMITPAFQLRYKLSQRLMLTMGAPVIFAFEWSPVPKIDLAFSQILLEYTEGFIRYNFSKNIGISVNYRSTGYSSADTYFKSESIQLNDQMIVYNNLTQNQKSISIKLGLKTSQNIGIILTGGYKIGQSIDLYNNENKLGNADGMNNFFIGLNIQYLKYL